MLERIAIERKDRPAIERYAEFRRRFQRAAGISTEESVAPAARPATAGPEEFVVPTIEAELDEPVADSASAEASSSMGIPMPVESVVHEVDLSEEWAALSQQLEDAMETSAPVPVAIPETPQEQEEVVAEAPAFELELQPVSSAGVAASETLTADALFAELATEFESASSSLGIPAELPRTEPLRATQTLPFKPVAPANGVPAPSAPPDGGLSGPLGDLFEEFRTELGEANKEEEDLETHYNLGIAYREMGLLEEAISEFQKVASAADKGPAFRYAMQCCTLLGLAFMEKGESSIAAMWYARALETPGLDQDSILALRYDLGVAQELAGETAAAFQQLFPGLRDEYRLQGCVRTNCPSRKDALDSPRMKSFLHALMTLDVFLLGVMLILVPWLGYWDHNFFLDRFPELIPILLHPCMRGAVTGLGALDVLLAAGMLRGPADSVATRT